jgi:hypothetical protein
MRELFCHIMKLCFFGNCHENTRKYSRACRTLAKTAKGVLSHQVQQFAFRGKPIVNKRIRPPLCTAADEAIVCTDGARDTQQALARRSRGVAIA